MPNLLAFFEQLFFCHAADDTHVEADTFLSIQSRFEALRGSRKADFPDETTECHLQFLPELMVRTLCWSYRAPFLMRPGSGRTPWMVSRWIDRSGRRIIRENSSQPPPPRHLFPRQKAKDSLRPSVPPDETNKLDKNWIETRM